MITHAAVKVAWRIEQVNPEVLKVTTLLYLGKRHGVIMQKIWKELGEIKIEQDMQGFVNDKTSSSPGRKRPRKPWLANK